MAAGKHAGYEQTAWEGTEQTIDLLDSKRIKVIVNGGAHNPKRLAERVQQLVSFCLVSAIGCSTHSSKGSWRRA